MSNKLLDIVPFGLHFNFELKKQISCTQYLTNETDNYVAFKVKTTNPKKYTVSPNTGVVPPRSYMEVVVTMQAQKEAPADMQCKDKFLFQCFVASPGTNAIEITSDMFMKEAGNQVEEIKLRVVYVDDPPPPAYKGSLPRASVPDHRAARALITRLTEEKNFAVQLNKKLQQELEKNFHPDPCISDQLKAESNKSESGCGILVNIKWYISTRFFRRKTVMKRGEVAYRVDI